MKIYLVKSTYPYEGSTISGVFSTEAMAKKFIEAQEKICCKYADDQAKTDYCTKLKSPKCLNEDMDILEYIIDDVNHYENNFKNLSIVITDAGKSRQ